MTTGGGREHRVGAHLRLEVAEYDAAIRRFIPAYEEMLQVAAREVLACGARHVLDLGAGTGALSEVLLREAPEVTVTLVDVDPSMLASARERLAPFGERARFLEASFHEDLPRADAAMASLSLHHIPSLERKTRVFEGIAAALPPGGVLVNADVTMPADEEGRRKAFDGWADHLVANGIARSDAFRHFDDWSDEDTYFPVGEEMAAMGEAGFEPEVCWRSGVSTVVVGRKTG